MPGFVGAAFGEDQVESRGERYEEGFCVTALRMLTHFCFSPQLSPAILMGLHEIARCIEARNYQQGLMVHTQVVSSSSFSEVSGFMPVLKVLMTIAGKLNV